MILLVKKLLISENNPFKRKDLKQEETNKCFGLAHKTVCFGRSVKYTRTNNKKECKYKEKEEHEEKKI